MIRYHLIYPIARRLCDVAMRLDIPWLFELSGTLEYYADQCAANASK